MRYALEHKEIKTSEAALNFGVGKSTLNKWISEFKQSSDGDIKMRGTGNYESDEAKEVARLKRELRDTLDAGAAYEFKTHLTNHCFGIRSGESLSNVLKATRSNINPHSHISILQVNLTVINYG